MKNQEVRFKDQINDEVGLGRSRSEMTDDSIPGAPKEPPITIEGEAILYELGLGRNPPPRNIVEQNEDRFDKQ